jgi:exonuclease III
MRICSFKLALALLALVAGSWNGCARVPEPQSEGKKRTGEVSVRVMSFNIEWGGANVRFASVVDAIRASGADIVGIQEAEGNLQRLATDLGWHYNLQNYVVSRHPIIDPPGSDGKFVYVEISPGEIVAIANVHLPSDPYGPNWIRDQRAPQEVGDMERTLRLPKIEPYLSVLRAVHEQGIPVFLTGDFNSPSHADWTPEVIGTRPFVEYPFDWPVSLAVVGAGFHDSFRDSHPDPVAHPGFTWWAKRERIRDYNPGDGDPRDRIDFLWYAGPATVTSSEIVGEAGAEGVSIHVMPWPSDHRGVVSSFDVIPAPLPTFVAVERRIYQSGDRIRIRYGVPGIPPGTLIVSSVGESIARAVFEVAAEPEGVELPADVLAPGRYRADLRSRSGASTGSNDFWVLDPDAVASVEVAGSGFAVGEPLPIRWQNGLGNRNDWLAVFKADVSSEYQNQLAWGYIGARPSGAIEMSASTTEEKWPIPAGRYVVRLLKDDGYEVLAESSPFTVE